jgi:hypothetical protein
VVIHPAGEQPRSVNKEERELGKEKKFLASAQKKEEKKNTALGFVARLKGHKYCTTTSTGSFL